MAKTTAIVLVLLMASVMLMAIPVQPAQAQLAAEQPVSGPLPLGATPSVTISTKIFLGFSPNPVGVGQSILINMWGHPPTHVERGFENAVQVLKVNAAAEAGRKLDFQPAEFKAWQKPA